MAVSGRLPVEDLGETDTVYRDIDLDGTEERLEIRGTGNAAKQIYVFKEAGRGFEYLGRLNAHPSFTVTVDANGTPTIEYLHRFGADEVELKRIQYVNYHFVEVSDAGP
jgi:hypothetical protein